MKQYYISDPHFGHEKIISLAKRPFANEAEMRETIINNWNRVVTDEDVVYILGDFSFKLQKTEAIKILKQLKGRKVLVIGNHDRYVGQRDFDNCFEKEAFYLHVNDEGRQVVLSHYPIWDWAGMYYGSYHLYGHIHDKTMPTDFNGACVSVEHINYTPVTLDQLIENKVFDK